MTANTPGRKKLKVATLDVLLHDREVGTITRFPDDRSLFTLHEDYARDPNRPTLSLSLKTSDGGVDVSRRPTRTRVAPFFSNLLPEGHLREYLARLGEINPTHEFFLLWLLGQDLPGAVTVRPADGNELPPRDEPPSGAATPEHHVMRFALAGVQLKFSAVMETDGGLTIPAEGVGGSWILKLPSARYPAVPEVEWAMMELARAVGIAVPLVKLVEPGDLANVPVEVTTLGRALAIARFDRGEAHQRIHIEDFAQVFNQFPQRKYERASYEEMARVLWAEAGQPSVIEFARRLAFSALIGNADMHLKNWSLIYRDGRTPELAPGYDFVATIAYLDDPQMALSLGATKAMHAVDLALFGRFADRAGLPRHLVMEAARETAERVRQAWGRHPALDVIPVELRKKIEAHMQLVPLGR